MSKFALQFKDRFNIFGKILWGKWRRLIIIFLPIVTVLGIIQSQIPTNSPFSKYAYLPQLEWFLWVIIGLGLFLVLTLEGAYSYLRAYRPMNWIEKYKLEHGVYPQIPEYLQPLVNHYTKGTPISKHVLPIAPSGQIWNKLLNSQKKEWEEMVKWLGKDPQDLIDLMKMMLPKDPPLKR